MSKIEVEENVYSFVLFSHPLYPCVNYINW